MQKVIVRKFLQKKNWSGEVGGSFELQGHGVLGTWWLFETGSTQYRLSLVTTFQKKFWMKPEKEVIVIVSRRSGSGDGVKKHHAYIGLRENIGKRGL